jgi:hypothetical protein
MWNMNKLKNLDKDELLEYLGLQTKRTAADWIVPSLTIFGAGLLVGAGIGLMFAPKPGAELRDDLRQRLQGGPDQMAGSFPATASASERPPRSI